MFNQSESQVVKTEIIETGNASLRLFFAIQPGKQAQKSLADIARKQAAEYGGRYIKQNNIHLTLIFLGQFDKHKLERLYTAVKNITAKPFELQINQICFWKQNQIIYAQANNHPDELFALTDAIKTALTTAEFKFDHRRFKPHITLVRKATNHKSIYLNKPITWQVNEWLLMQSKHTDLGIQYIPIRRWPLH